MKLALILGCLVSLDAHAFGLGDHEEITRQAVVEFNRCFPDRAVRPSEEAAIVSSNRSEDMNVFRKWTRYSHYYHPFKTLQMRRRDSSARLADLEESLHDHASDADQVERDIGHVLHHVQDMASPPHVVPVNHWLTDGFEVLDVEISSSGAGDCSEFLTASGYADVLQRTAETTLLGVRSGTIASTVGLRAVDVPLTMFWEEASGNGMGSYGAFGNSFGSEYIETSSGVYVVSLADYRAYKQHQLRLAIEASKRVFVLWKN